MIGNDIDENSFYPYITCKRSVDYPEWYDDNNWNGVSTKNEKYINHNNIVSMIKDRK